MIAAHPSVLQEEQRQQEEIEEMLRAVLVKVANYLTEDELTLLQFGCSVNLKH